MEYITDFNDQLEVDKMNKEFKMFKFKKQFLLKDGKLFLSEPKHRYEIITGRLKAYLLTKTNKY